MNWLREYAIKKWLNDESEINKLESFFDDYEVIKGLEEAEKNRIKRYMWLFPSCLIAFFGVVFIASLWVIQVEIGDTWNYRNSVAFDGIYYWSILWFLVFGIIVGIFRKRIEWAIKENILSKLSKQIYEKLEYNWNKKYAFWDIKELRNVNFLNSYERIDKIEDSIAFTLQKDWRYATIQGYELETSEVRWSWKNRRRVTTNHCYLLKTRLPSARININTDIFIKTDKADNFWHNIIISIIIWLIVWFFIGMFSQNMSVWIISFLVVSWIVYFFVKKSNNKNRVKLESIEFEKLYDVQCLDQVTSRMIITPAFMDRLVQLSQKTKNKNEFLFRWDVFYVKWNLSKSYLEINTWKKITKNIETFIDWYWEMKEIISFIKDMQILYLSKTEQIYVDWELAPQYETMNESDLVWTNNVFGNMLGWKFWNIWIGNFSWKFTLK